MITPEEDRPVSDGVEEDVAFALICNHLVSGVIYDEEVRVHQVLENVFMIETTTNDNEMISIGLSVIQGRHEDQDLVLMPTIEINPFRYTATVLVGDE